MATFQVLGPDLIGSLSQGGGSVSLAASRLTIGGLQYLTGVLSVSLVSLTPASLYFIYVVISGGTPTLVLSTNVNSVGPTSFTSWKLVGAFYSDTATTLGSFVTIDGVPASNRTTYSPVTQGFGSIVNPHIFYERYGDRIILEAYFTVGTPTGSQAQFGLPGTLLTDTTVFGGTRIGSASRNNTSNAANAFTVIGDSSINYVTFSNSSTSGVNALSSQPGNGLVATSDAFSLFASVKVQGWLNTALKDL